MKLEKLFFGMLWIFMLTALGLTYPDRVVCKFTESDQCYVALGQQLHLLIPVMDNCNLIKDSSYILRYRKAHSSTLQPRWQFVSENNTVILSSAESSDYGTYILETFDASGRKIGNYILQLQIKGLTYPDRVVCKFTESDQCYVALGQQLHLQIPVVDKCNLIKNSSYILRYRKPHSSTLQPRWQFVSENNTVILSSAESSDSGTYILETFDASGRMIDNYILQLHIKVTSYGFRVFISVWVFEIILLSSLLLGTHIYTRINRKQRTTENQQAQ